MSDQNQRANGQRMQIYFSAEAWAALVDLMGAEGKPSPTINQIIIEAYQEKQKKNN